MGGVLDVAEELEDGPSRVVIQEHVWVRALVEDGVAAGYLARVVNGVIGEQGEEVVSALRGRRVTHRGLGAAVH